MTDAWEYVRSVESAVALWAAAAAALVALGAWAAGRLRPVDLAALARDEDGAAYSLSYAMAMPVYVFLCLLIVELSLILLAKLGSVNAAFAAARNNIVYRSLDPAEAGPAPPRARRAAVRAMAPYGSSSAVHLSDGSPSAGGDRDADDYAAAARRYAPDLAYNDRSIRAGYHYADRATTVAVAKPGSDPNDPLEATVTFRVPLRMPIAARLLGVRSPAGGAYYVWAVRTTVRLPDEAPRTPATQAALTPGMPLGIRLDPPR